MQEATEKRCAKCNSVKPVTNFHVEKRYPGKRRSWCKVCMVAAGALYRKDHSERCHQYSRRYYETHSEQKYSYSRGWLKEHPEKSSEYARNRYKWQSASPRWRLSNCIRAGIYISLQKGSKNGRHWESLVDFTLDQLKAHLEKQFLPGMTWENHGSVWHIDHKIPVAAFNFQKPEDIDFKRCWALKNLRPLWKKANLSKKAKLDKPFQPALTI